MADGPEEAYVSENQLFSEVPHECLEDIKSYKRLRKLSFKNNELYTLPPSLCQLPNLQSLYYLNLSHNRFAQVPNCILRLRSLEILDLSYNQLIDLPSNMGDLVNLKVLSLNANNIQTLPLPIADLPNLLILELENNPLRLPSKLSPYSDDEQWLERARVFMKQFPQEFQQKPFPSPSIASNPTLPLGISVNPAAPTATSAVPNERVRSVSESGVNLRATRRMGFVMQRNAPGASIVANLHARGSSQDNLNELEHKRSASATFSNSHLHTPHQHTLQTPLEDRRSPFGSPRGSPRPSTSEEQRLEPLQEATPELRTERQVRTQPLSVQTQLPPQSQIQSQSQSQTQLSAPLSAPPITQSNLSMPSIPFSNPSVSSIPAYVPSIPPPSVPNPSSAARSQPTLPKLQTQQISTPVSANSFSPDLTMQSIKSCVDMFSTEISRLSCSQKLRKQDDLVLQLMEVQSVLDTLINSSDKLDRKQHRELAAMVVKLLPELENTWREAQKRKMQVEPTECMLDEQLRVQLCAASSKTNKVLGLLNRLISSLALQSTDDPAFAALISSRVRELSSVCIRCGVCTRQLSALLAAPVPAAGKRFYDEVNMFLRAVISVLSGIKAALPDIPELAEGVVGPEVASLTRVVKEIPPLLEQSSYRYILEYSEQSMNIGMTPLQPSAPTPLTATLGQAAKMLVSPVDRQERPNQSFFDAVK